MAVDEAARHQLYTSLESTLGSEPTSTLMSLLPPVGGADVATKQDLAILEANLHRDIADLRTEVADAMRRQTVSLVGVMVTLYGIAWATITFG